MAIAKMDRRWARASLIAALASVAAALLAFAVGIGIGVITIYLPALHEFCAKVGSTCMFPSAQGEGFGWELIFILPAIILLGILVSVLATPIVFMIALRRELRRPQTLGQITATFE